tara:strand:- start:153 stop:755 length:603 start_codon:yes stop_codon:yes gene_type:complete
MFSRNKINMIVCDMAGTIIQEKGIVYKSLYNTIKLIKPDLERKEINKFYGCNKKEVIDYFVDIQKMNSPDIVKNNLNSEFNYFLKQEYKNNKDVTLIHHNLPSFFNALREQDIKIALNTGYNKEIQKVLIDKFNLNEYIDDYISSQEVSRGRPYPHMLNNLIRRNNINDPSSVVKIGDSIPDILEGKNANTKTDCCFIWC